MSQFEGNKRAVFAEKLRKLMKNYHTADGKKLSQAGLGKELHVARETVSSWLNCKNYPSDETINQICDFFKVPYFYFASSKGLTKTDEETHKSLQYECMRYANAYGLNTSLLQFLKDIPACADAIVSASWVDEYTQSLDIDVPAVDSPFQFVASSGVKIYPPEEVLLMLRIVQRELSDYALFQIQKWAKFIDESYERAKKIGETYTDKYCERIEKTNKEWVSATDKYYNELFRKDKLSPGSGRLVDIYEMMEGNEQIEFLEMASKYFSETRRNKRKNQKNPTYPKYKSSKAETEKK